MFTEQVIPTPANTHSRALQQHIFSLLQDCNSFKKLTQIHAQLVLNALTQKNFILVKLLSLYVSSGYPSHAHKIFENIQNPSTAAWNQIIRGHAYSDMPRNSIMVFKRMESMCFEPDRFTYSFVLSGCVRSDLVRVGEQVHGRVLSNGYCSNVFVQTNLVNLYATLGGECGLASGFKVFDEMSERTVVSWNSLLNGCVRSGDVDGAWRVFDSMPERNVVSWTTMISGFAQNGRCRQALNLFHAMRRARVELDQVAFVAALSACAELGDLRLGRWIHSYVNEAVPFKGKPLQVSLMNALVHMYSSCGAVDEAYRVFKNMSRRTTISWTKELDPDRAANYLVLLSNVYATEKRWEIVASIREEITKMGVTKPPGQSRLQINRAIHDFVAGDSTHKQANTIYDMLGSLTRQAKQIEDIPSIPKVFTNVNKEDSLV
ncbi:Pentatricopeptide repeat [Dillenia turbinata]|uniref:Pentatricopeptide repeat n=1 Tax=Dillenia turbinata TaxID=194707 RepID=A0AAN8V3T6_9MAGN